MRADSRNRAIHLTFAVLIVLSIYAGRIFDLMVVNGDALAEGNQPQQQVFRADVTVIEPVGFAPGQLQHLLRSGGKIVHGFLLAVRFAGRRSSCRSRRARSTSRSSPDMLRPAAVCR